MRSSAVSGTAFLDRGHDHAHCLEDALDRAATVCRSRGARLTPLRRRVLELVWSGHKPLGAYEILDVLKGERGGAAPPTVYRALDFLRRQGLVHRIESRNSFIGCPEPEAPHAVQFLICSDCGLAAELSDKGIDDAIRKGAAKAGFAVGRRTVEIEGVCPNCRRD